MACGALKSIHRFVKLSRETSSDIGRIGRFGHERELLLARYRCEVGRKPQQLLYVSDPTFYDTPFASPQLELIELDDEQWIKFQRRPSRSYTRRMAMLPPQLSLIDVGTSALVMLALNAI